MTQLKNKTIKLTYLIMTTKKKKEKVRLMMVRSQQPPKAAIKLRKLLRTTKQGILLHERANVHRRN